MKVLLFLMLSTCIAAPGFATIECTLDVHAIFKQNHHACKRTSIVVKQGSKIIGSAVTNNRGNCVLNFNVGSGELTDKSTWLYFYAARNVGDTALLKFFYRFPKSFKKISDQHFSTTFYLLKK